MKVACCSLTCKIRYVEKRIDFIEFFKVLTTVKILQPSDKVDEYINIVCQQIRSKKVHRDISDELEKHIRDQKEAFISNGIDEETATLKAIDEMGDPIVVGVELDCIHRPKPEWSVIGLTMIVIIMGLVTRFILADSSELSSYYFGNQIYYTVIGLIVLAVTYFIDFSIIGKYPKAIFFTLFISYMIFCSFLTPSWVFSSKYVVLLFVPLFGIIIYSMHGKGYLGIILTGVFYFLSIFSILNFTYVGLTICIQITICCLAILTVMILKGWFGSKKINSLSIVYSSVLLCIVAVVVKIFSNPYLIERIKAFIYTDNVVKKVIDSSKFLGTATIPELNLYPLESIIPNSQNDFMLLYLIAKFGFAVGLVIIIFFMLWIIRMFVVSLKQKNSLGFIISFSGTLIIAIQGISYIISNLGFNFPPLALPLMSYGGSSFVVNMCIIGLILSAFRNDDLDRNSKIEVAGDSFFKFESGKLIIDFNRHLSKL